MALSGPLSGYGSAYTLSGASSSNFIPDLWQDSIKYERDQALMLARYVKQIDFRGRKTDTLYIPIVKGVAVNTKTPETPRKFQTHQDSTYVIQVDRHRESTFMVEDVVALQSIVDHMQEYTKQHGYAMGLYLEKDLLAARADIMGDSTRQVYCTSDATSSGTFQFLSEAAILTAKEKLDDVRCPHQGRMLFVDSSQANQLVTIDAFRSLDVAGGGQASVSTGRITGSIHGFTVVQLDTLSKNTDTGHFFSDNQNTTDAYSPGFSNAGTWWPSQNVNTLTGLGTVADEKRTAIACGPEWLALAMQRDIRVEKERNFQYIADAVGFDFYYGYKVYREKEAVLIHSA